MHGSPHSANVADVCKRVAIHDHQIRALARFNRADFQQRQRNCVPYACAIHPARNPRRMAGDAQPFGHLHLGDTVLGQNLIPTPNASRWSHITPVNHVISGFPKLLKLQADEVLAKDRLEKPLRPEMEFEEDDDFWEHLSFDVTNVSEKTVVYLDTTINLYARDVIQRMADRNRDHEAFAHEDVAIMAIELGDPSNIDPPHRWSLKPGESTTITIDPEMRDFVRRQVLQFSSPVIRVGINASLIFFDDGSTWSFSGIVKPPKS